VPQTLAEAVRILQLVADAEPYAADEEGKGDFFCVYCADRSGVLTPADHRGNCPYKLAWNFVKIPEREAENE
jgi:hypothetical protein